MSEFPNSLLILTLLNFAQSRGKQIMYLFITAVGVGPLFQVPLVALQVSSI